MENLWIATLKRLVRSEALAQIQPIFFKKRAIKIQ